MLILANQVYSSTSEVLLLTLDIIMKFMSVKTSRDSVLFHCPSIFCEEKSKLSDPFSLIFLTSWLFKDVSMLYQYFGQHAPNSTREFFRKIEWGTT